MSRVCASALGLGRQPAHALPPRRAAFARHFTGCGRLCRAYQAGDMVLLREKRDTRTDGTLILLQPDTATTNTHRGILTHADVIGKHPRQTVTSSRGDTFRIYEPTLAEYVRLTPRLVTPIYPSDANLIVSLLDIHVDTPVHAPRPQDPPLEILEAGTGHGALTLHLSRAIHAANPPLTLQDATLDSWKGTRRAIIHTLDISAQHSQFAQKVVARFRRGIYARNVDYHVGDISEWIVQERSKRGMDHAFLSHVFLDLPNADKHLANVAPALHPNGTLAVFNPSITQIAECVDTIRAHKMPYILDRVVELGAGTIREWDVRQVKPRATLRKAAAQEASGDTIEHQSDVVDNDQRVREEALSKDSTIEDDKWAMICRPKAGQQVIGGGFLGLWRRMERPVDNPLTL
ncbi:hypothetical protein ACN47E_006361 [Coniothyrium glycines]